MSSQYCVFKTSGSVNSRGKKKSYISAGSNYYPLNFTQLVRWAKEWPPKDVQALVLEPRNTSRYRDLRCLTSDLKAGAQPWIMQMAPNITTGSLKSKGTAGPSSDYSPRQQ